MKAFLNHRSRRWGFHGWALLVKGAEKPLDWTTSTTREEARELRRERGNLLRDSNPRHNDSNHSLTRASGQNAGNHWRQEISPSPYRPLKIFSPDLLTKVIMSCIITPCSINRATPAGGEWPAPSREERDMTCIHEHITVGPDYGFTNSVAVPPYTKENQAAHGNIVHTETCLDCGMERDVAINQQHVEYGPWGPGPAEREQRAARQLEQLGREQHTIFPRLRESGTVVVRSPSGVIVHRDGQTWDVSLGELRAAATQPDTGDGLPQYYTEVLRAAGYTR